jgi:hypothetical protein
LVLSLWANMERCAQARNCPLRAARPTIALCKCRDACSCAACPRRAACPCRTSRSASVRSRNARLADATASSPQLGSPAGTCVRPSQREPPRAPPSHSTPGVTGSGWRSPSVPSHATPAPPSTRALGFGVRVFEVPSTVAAIILVNERRRVRETASRMANRQIDGGDFALHAAMRQRPKALPTPDLRKLRSPT